MQQSNSNLPVSAEMQQTLGLKIKEMLMGMIPDEKINLLIEQEINAFFTEENTSFVYSDGVQSYGRNERETLTAKISPFRALVWRECSVYAQKMLKDFFENSESPFFATAVHEWMAPLNGGPGGAAVNVGGVLSEAMEERLQQQALAMAASMFRGIFAGAAEVARSSISRDLANAGIFNQHGQPIL